MQGGTPFIVTVRTVPDLAGGKRVYGLQGLSDAEALQAIDTLRRIRNGGEAWPLPLQRITAIAVAGFTGQAEDGFCFGALGEAAATEGQLLKALNDVLRPALLDSSVAVGWQGPEYLWPLLECRALVHGLASPVRAGDRHAAWDLQPLFTGPAMAQIGLRELAALWGEPLMADDADNTVAAQRKAAELDAMLLMRISMKVLAARGHDTQKQAAGLKLWTLSNTAAHLAAFRLPANQ